MQLSQAFPALDPWTLGDRWTWPRIWLAVRHLMDEAAERKRHEKKAVRSGPHESSGSGRGGPTVTRKRVKYETWAAEDIAINGH